MIHDKETNREWRCECWPRLSRYCWVPRTQLAQGYPNKPVRVVVGFAAGGPSDVIARIVAQKLSETLGQQLYVENVGGAGGNTAAGQVARAAPDGYTIHIVSTGFMVNMSLYAKVPYDAVKDFAPVTLVAYSPNVVIVNPSVPVKDIKELSAAHPRQSGQVFFRGPRCRLDPHLAGEQFRLSFNLDLVHVPFTGAGPAIQSTHRGPHADRLHGAAASPWPP